MGLQVGGDTYQQKQIMNMEGLTRNQAKALPKPKTFGQYTTNSHLVHQFSTFQNLKHSGPVKAFASQNKKQTLASLVNKRIKK